MLSRLRLRLTLLYLLVALALVALVGASTYRLLDYYFQSATDLALQTKMAQQFRLLGAPLPPALAAADRAWRSGERSVLPALPTARPEAKVERKREEDDEHASERRANGEREVRDSYDGELAPIFVLPLSNSGLLLFDPNPFEPPLVPDTQAAATAMVQGSDWRTVRLADGTRVRLLTYRLPRGDGPAVLQLGRTMADQDRLLRQLLGGLLALGAASTLFMGAGAWWLAGRSLRPLQQAWEQQQTFVANASHELRTPLTLIRASTEVALRGMANDDERRGLLNDVLEECDHVSRMVEDLLLLSRLDAGRLTLEHKPVLLADLLADLARQVGRLAGEQGVELTVESRAGAVWGDYTRLRQVLLILLDNALRHTPAGGRIAVAAVAQGRKARIEVADTGSGIPAEHLPHVFERFYRAQSGSGEGAGLGLAIAKALVEAQQGQIAVESEPGKGTRVVITLASAGSLPHAAPPQPGGSGRTS